MFAKRSFSLIRHLKRSIAIRSLSSIALIRRNSSRILSIRLARHATLPTVHVSSSSDLTLIDFERQSEHTLQYLNTFIEDISDKFELGADFDVSYSGGVLSIAFGLPYGTYVINKQTPNKQIWLSSPKSGPKRFDYDVATHSWICRNDCTDLFSLLSEEISEILNSPIVIKNPLCDS
nr:frataxin mitochondrial [Hymenolepis microstoma]